MTERPLVRPGLTIGEGLSFGFGFWIAAFLINIVLVAILFGLLVLIQALSRGLLSGPN